MLSKMSPTVRWIVSFLIGGIVALSLASGLGSCSSVSRIIVEQSTPGSASITVKQSDNDSPQTSVTVSPNINLSHGKENEAP